MAVTIDATVGGSSANSYVTLAEAQAYMLGRLNSDAWDNATTDQQNRALVEATIDISFREWKGTQATTTQALAWPRWYVINPDQPWSGYCYYSATVIPDRVKNATCELAFQFLVAGTSDIASIDPTIGIQTETVGPLSTTYVSPSQRAQGLRRFPRAWNYIVPLVMAGNRLSVPLVRG